MTNSVLVWRGTFDAVAAAAPSPEKLLPTGPKDASGKTEKRQRSSNDDDDNDKAIEDLENELKRRREAQEIARAQRIPQRIAELEKKIKDEKEVVERLQESIRKDTAELVDLQKKQIPREVAERVLQYFENYRLQFADQKVVYLKDRFGKRYTYNASVNAYFDGNWFQLREYVGYFQSTKLALLLMENEAGEEFTLEARQHIANSIDAVPSLEMQQMMTRARASIEVSVWKQYYDDRMPSKLGEGYQTFKQRWGWMSQEDKIFG